MKRFKIYCIMFLMFTILPACGYNQMQFNEEAVNKAWGNVESNLQRRADLIPNLVNVVKAYAKHEKETLTDVIEARAKATSVKIGADALSNPAAMQNFANAQGELSSALSKLMVVVEKYPDLKANENFRDLQVQLEGTENRINYSRQEYNDAVATFNKSIRAFPYNLTNSFLLHLTAKEYYKAAAGATAVPQVNFD